MELTILSANYLAKEKQFKDGLNKLEIPVGKSQVQASIWKGLQPELLIENGQEFDRSIIEKVVELYDRIFPTVSPNLSSRT